MNEAIEKAKVYKANKEKEEKLKDIRSRGDTESVSGTVSDVIEEAYKHLGSAYVWGGAGPVNFDCSGFMQYIYRVAAGVSIGRTTYSQINNGVEVSYSNLKPGDLIFPNDHHVQLYIGNGYVIHAPQTGEVIKVVKIYGFWRARRIIN